MEAFPAAEVCDVLFASQPLKNDPGLLFGIEFAADSAFDLSDNMLI